MPLHLLGKKSWNVYNADNVARVRRDEAAAKAAEEAEEQRMQEVDAQRRLAILRGEVPPPLTQDKSDDSANAVREKQPSLGSGSGPGRPAGRKRKREGEDDTDFELRLARERAEPATKSPETSQKPSSSSAPIVDRRGHFDLFGDEKSRAHAEKNEEAEREARKKKRELEDQYTMRLSSAAGKDGSIKRPWYSRGDADRQAEPLKDVWGNDDPRRKQRDADRIAANDPLALMKKGASRVRELKQERRKIQDERDEDLGQMRKEDRRRERRRGRYDGESRHRGASPEPSRRRQRSRERKDDGYKRDRGRGRDRDRDRERRRHEHSESLGSRARGT